MNLMERFHISGVPIVSAEGHLVGILTNRDVRFADNPAQPSNPPRRVRFGEGTTDEMGAIVMDYVLAPAAIGEAGAKMAVELMSRHDANKDGKLSREELMAADPSKKNDIDRALSRFDADKDGLLNAAELNAACNALVTSRGG